MVCPAIVADGHNRVISLMPEFIKVAVGRRLPGAPRTDPDVRANASGSSLRF